ncbi:MAG: DNA-binding response regulator [Chthoniobacteraceae bacterium]|nr:DNA-binding response regulator [Chthoniobacteraceae bacterium]
MIRVGIIEDNAIVRNSFKDWIDSEPGYECVCAFASAEAALAGVAQKQPEVILMDIHLPGASGIACTAQLKIQQPRLQIIIVTIYRDHDLIFQALRAGASGYLLKRSEPLEIIRAIAEVRVGGAPMTPEIARQVVEFFQKPGRIERATELLSAREEELLALLAEGLSNKEIGARLKISYDTVRNHLKHIYEKLHVRCRTEAARTYLQTHRYDVG